MANIIKIKRSTTAGNTPGLVDGEFAINQADMKFFTKNSAGVTKFIDFTSDVEKVASGAIANAFALKANLSGANFTGNVGLPSAGGTTYFTIGTGDGASYTTHNSRLHLHWGLAIERFDGAVMGVYDARLGIWNTKGAPQVNGQNVWYPGNFDPTTKANLSGADFGGPISAPVISTTTGEGYVELRPGGQERTGYISFINKAGGRHGYIGFADANEITLGAELGRFNFNGATPTVNTNTIWHGGNFTPDNKANLTGADFSGTVTAPYFSSQLGASGVNGYLNLVPGDSTHSGYISFYRKDGVRLGYIGYGDDNGISFASEKGNFTFTGGTPTVGGKVIWNAGNFDPDNLAYTARARDLISGGGIISVSTGGRVSWTNRFILMGGGRLENTSGYYEFLPPATGTVIPGYCGAASDTTTADGILISSWTTLYAIPNAAGGSTAYSYALVTYTADFTVPRNWIPLISQTNDSGAYYRFPGGITLIAGESYDNTEYSSTRKNTLTIATPANNAGNLRLNNTSGDGSRISFYTAGAQKWVNYVSDTQYNIYSSVAGNNILTLTPTSMGLTVPLVVNSTATVNNAVFDTSGTSVRIYERSTPFRGVFIDFNECGSQSRLWHNGNFDPATKAGLNAGNVFTQRNTFNDLVAPVLGQQTATVSSLNSNGSINKRIHSGFWQYPTGTQALGYPEDNNSWFNIIASTHNNEGNYYSMQIASSFFQNTDFYMRNTMSEAIPASAGWNKLWHDKNFNPAGKHNLNSTVYKDVQNAEDSAFSFIVAANGRTVYQYGNKDRVGLFDSGGSSIWAYNIASKTVEIPNIRTPDSITDYSGSAVNTQYLRRMLGQDNGINWKPFQERILVDKSHGPAAQGIFDIQCTTRVGDIAGQDGTKTGGASSITSVIVDGTKYGHFNFVAQAFNYSKYNEANGDTFLGHTGSCLYAFQMDVDSSPCWGTAIELREMHKLPNPRNGSLAFEATVIATGTDNNNKRCLGFFPFNSSDGAYTEFAQGIYFKTASTNMLCKSAIHVEGNYRDVIRTQHYGFNNLTPFTARTLVLAEGSFSGHAITLHNIGATLDNTAISLNAAHTLTWKDASNNYKGHIGWDNDTLVIGNPKRRSTVGAVAEYLEVNIGGVRRAIPLYALA